MSPSLQDSKISKALSRIRRDGILHPVEDILGHVEHPHWERAMLAHDWRKHVPPAMRDTWETLPLDTRLCVYESAEWSAMEEDLDSAMVTGPARGLR